MKELHESGVDITKLLGEVQKEREEDSQERELIRHGSIRSVNSHDFSNFSQEEEQEQMNKGSVGAYVYKAYFRAGGNVCLICTLFFIFVLAQLCGSAADYFISYW